MIEMIAGAARELKLGELSDPSTHVGPVIDAEAKQRLDAHIARMKKQARVHFAGSALAGNFMRRISSELSDAGELTEESPAITRAALSPTSPARCCKIDRT
jgi:RHH-type proline utilization regulon transcriptional repressor/proline dehydrogenase/delta 1-pyrroline-5-carboxylate dehydrogenase